MEPEKPDAGRSYPLEREAPSKRLRVVLEYPPSVDLDADRKVRLSPRPPRHHHSLGAVFPHQPMLLWNQSDARLSVPEGADGWADWRVRLEEVPVLRFTGTKFVLSRVVRVTATEELGPGDLGDDDFLSALLDSRDMHIEGDSLLDGLFATSLSSAAVDDDAARDGT